MKRNQLASGRTVGGEVAHKQMISEATLKAEEKMYFMSVRLLIFRDNFYSDLFFPEPDRCHDISKKKNATPFKV